MIQEKRYLHSVLSTDLSQDVLLSPGSVTAAMQDGAEVTFTVSLVRKRALPGLLYFDQVEQTEEKLFLRLRFYGGEILRLMISLTPRRFEDESPMVSWYQSLLRPLLEMGAAAIKADFGEQVDEGAMYARMDGEKYHNLFALLYQKAVWEITEQVHGRGNTLIWARSAWAGSQRYPVHWGDDAASTFDGLAGTICGGLPFGLSGFPFWSHDVAGIHGIPDFVHSRPTDELYVRWTQVGVFSSHIRYHGGSPREPWEYPAVSEIIREWLRFRYALLPYILEQAHQSCLNGLPMLRSLVLDWPDDPAAWSIADEYLFGDHFLVCPVLNAAGVRSVYLPEGRWVDFWSGQALSGPLHLQEFAWPLSRLPLYVRFGSEINFAEPVAHTGLLPQAKVIAIPFDEGYPGFDACPLKEWLRFDPS